METSFMRFFLFVFGCVMLATLAQGEDTKGPNILYILGDQWRAQATGYAGDPNLQGFTPNLDKLAGQSVNFVNAVSGMPVCTPYRASLLTGQYPLSHGLFLNDLQLPTEAVTIAEVLGESGYATGFIGKWHLDGHGRRSYIPEDRRQGFEYWKVLECTHDYNDSYFYERTDPKIQKWEEYDAFAQTRDAQRYMLEQSKGEKPFALFLSWGPPHNPYQSAPTKFRDMFKSEDIKLRPNVSDAGKRTVQKIRNDLAGYYAHIVALDDSIGDLMSTLDELGIADDTIVVFTSDHGDMIGSQAQQRKQRPWDESIRVPFLIRYSKEHNEQGREVPTLLNSPDIMPTLLALASVDAPKSVEGRSFADIIRGGETPDRSSALIACISPFGEYVRGKGGKEYRGVRTERYTYVRDLKGPWLLFDNEADPYQINNLVGNPQYSDLQVLLEKDLQQHLTARNDTFLIGDRYIEQWNYTVNESGTVPYTNEIPAEALK
jgi:arylsulfatase A-like enzyme